MAQYTARDLKNVTKTELKELLKKEGIEYDDSMPYFALRARLLNANETKKDDAMRKKNEEAVVEKEEKEAAPVEDTVELEQAAPVEEKAEPAPVKPTEKTKAEKKKTRENALAALRGEINKRKGITGFGKSAFAAELAKRKGERTSGVSFAQELRARQLKYKGK